MINYSKIILFIVVTTILITSFSLAQENQATPDTNKKENIFQAENNNEQSSENAENSENAKTEENRFSSTSNELFFQSLIIFLLLIAILYLVYRFFSKRKNMSIVNSDFINVLGTSTIAANKYVQVIEIGKKIYVLGISDHNISLITEIQDKEEIDYIKLNYKNDMKNISFKNQLSNFLEKFQKKDKQQNETDTNNTNKSKIQVETDFIKKQKERLKNLSINSK